MKGRGQVRKDNGREFKRLVKKQYKMDNCFSDS